uniref:Uncharacterized protein n=1 Tax=Oryza punctata TaxID=4537 RepID=A0A0E0JFJ3_ORYPU
MEGKGLESFNTLHFNKKITEYIANYRCTLGGGREACVFARLRLLSLPESDSARQRGRRRLHISPGIPLRFPRAKATGRGWGK